MRQFFGKSQYGDLKEAVRGLSNPQFIMLFSNKDQFDSHVFELEKLYPGVPSIGCVGMCYDTRVVEKGVGVIAFSDGVQAAVNVLEEVSVMPVKYINRLMEDVRTGKVDCIVVKDLSRFGRNYLEVGDYLEHLFPFLGIRFIAVNDNYDSQDYTGANAGIDIAFKNILHDYYSRDLSIKVRSAQRSRMKTGKYVNVPPYGYQRDPDDKHHLLPDPDTAPVVRRIFQMIMTEAARPRWRRL